MNSHTVSPIAQHTTQSVAASTSTWGDIGGLNLEDYEDWEEDVHEPLDVEALVANLVQSSLQHDADSMEQLLQQLSSPEAPPYAIIGCDNWPELAQLLPSLLINPNPGVAAEALQLLQQQLAPELLHSSPEPLAQLLTALLQCHPSTTMPAPQGTPVAHVDMAGPIKQPCHAATPTNTRGQHDVQTAGTLQQSVPAAPVEAAASTCGGVYSPAVLQFIISGLQKLGRQFHFLEGELCERLCAAVVAVLLEAILAPLNPTFPGAATTACAAHQTAPQAQPSGSKQLVEQQQEQQVQQQQHCLGCCQAAPAGVRDAAAAVADTGRQQSSWHSTPLRSHADQQEHHHDQQQREQQQQQAQLCMTPVQQSQQDMMLSHPQAAAQHSPNTCTCAAQPYLALLLLQVDPAFSWWHRLNANNASSRPLKAAMHQQGMAHLLLGWAQQSTPPGTPAGSTSPTSSVPPSQQPSAAQEPVSTAAGCCRCGCAGPPASCAAAALQRCLVVHCLAALCGTHSGRQLLARAGSQPMGGQQLSPQQEGPHPQDLAPKPEPGAITHSVQEHVGTSSSQQPLAAALGCLKGWVGLQAQAAQQPCSPWGLALDPSVAMLLAGGPATCAASGLAALADAADNCPQAARAQQALGRPVPALEAVGDAVLQGAAAVAAWAVHAYEEQHPWFVRNES